MHPFTTGSLEAELFRRPNTTIQAFRIYQKRRLLKLALIRLSNAKGLYSSMVLVWFWPMCDLNLFPKTWSHLMEPFKKWVHCCTPWHPCKAAYQTWWEVVVGSFQCHHIMSTSLLSPTALTFKGFSIVIFSPKCYSSITLKAGISEGVNVCVCTLRCR